MKSRKNEAENAISKDYRPKKKKKIPVKTRRHENVRHNNLNSSPPGQTGRHFADDIFKYIFLNEKFCILIRISLKFVPKGQIDYRWALVQIMAWRRPSDKPLCEPMMVGLYIFVHMRIPHLTLFFKQIWYIALCLMEYDLQYF